MYYDIIRKQVIIDSLDIVILSTILSISITRKISEMLIEERKQKRIILDEEKKKRKLKSSLIKHARVIKSRSSFKTPSIKSKNQLHKVKGPFKGLNTRGGSDESIDQLFKDIADLKKQDKMFKMAQHIYDFFDKLGQLLKNHKKTENKLITLVKEFAFIYLNIIVRMNSFGSKSIFYFTPDGALESVIAGGTTGFIFEMFSLAVKTSALPTLLIIFTSRSIYQQVSSVIKYRNFERNKIEFIKSLGLFFKELYETTRKIVIGITEDEFEPETYQFIGKKTNSINVEYDPELLNLTKKVEVLHKKQQKINQNHEILMENFQDFKKDIIEEVNDQISSSTEKNDLVEIKNSEPTTKTIKVTESLSENKEEELDEIYNSSKPEIVEPVRVRDYFRGGYQQINYFIEVPVSNSSSILSTSNQMLESDPIFILVFSYILLQIKFKKISQGTLTYLHEEINSGVKASDIYEWYECYLSY